MVDIQCEDKLESIATPADDIEGALYKVLPPGYSKSSFVFDGVVEEDAAEFKPMGDKIGSYVRPAASISGGRKGKSKAKVNGDADTTLSEDDENAVVYEMYRVSVSIQCRRRAHDRFQSTWATPGFKEYHRRMQIFILLYIEGGSFVQVSFREAEALSMMYTDRVIPSQEDEDNWEFVVLYERRKRPGSGIFSYHFVGYCSVFPFWCYPDSVRLRLRLACATSTAMRYDC